jgi:hypothetical protein
MFVSGRLMVHFSLFKLSTTVQLYDFILTFPQEVSLIWPAPWSLMKVLFLLTRYLPFADVVIRLWRTNLA